MELDGSAFHTYALLINYLNMIVYNEDIMKI